MAVKRSILAALVILALVGTIFYLDASLRPAWLKSFFKGATDQPLGLSETRAIEVGAQAPDFALHDLSGRTVRLSDFRGRKVVLNFWASWCPPCKQEMPDFESVYREHRNELIFLGVNMQETPDTVQRFLREEVQVTYPIVLDSDGSVTRGYNVRVYPTTYFLDEQGRFVMIGSLVGKFGPFTREELTQQVREFLRSASASRISQRGGVGDADRRNQSPPKARLGSKYFSAGELERIGLSMNLDEIPYRAELELDLLVTGCPFVDCIKSIDSPSFETPSETASWLKGNDLVMGVVLEGTAKAYPLKILTWHEIVNDFFGELPVVITFCPLCNSGLVFKRPVLEAKLAEFGVSGRLYKSDLVMYDRVTGTFWSQMEAAPIVGPLVGAAQSLERFPLEVVPWQNWRALHPDTLVLARPTMADRLGGRAGRPLDNPASKLFLQDYNQNPYEYQLEATVNYFAGPLLKDKRIDPFTTVLGLEVNDFAKAYLPEAIQQIGLLNDTLGGEPVLVVWNPTLKTVEFFNRRLPRQAEPLDFYKEGDRIKDHQTGTLWDFEAESLTGSLKDRPAKLEKLVAVQSFWFAWLAFHPKTELYSLDQSP
jgi:thiol-disulfide isomerase/thioredoxin